MIAVLLLCSMLLLLLLLLLFSILRCPSSKLSQTAAKHP
jgi:hypothetical protein